MEFRQVQQSQGVRKKPFPGQSRQPVSQPRQTVAPPPQSQIPVRQVRQVGVAPQIQHAPPPMQPPIDDGVVKYNDDFNEDVEQIGLDFDPTTMVRTYHKNRVLESGKAVVVNPTQQERQVLRKIGDKSTPVVSDNNYYQVSSITHSVFGPSKLRNMYADSAEINKSRIPTSIRHLGFDAMWSKYKGKGEVVAIIDAGIDKHPDLEGKIIRRVDFTSEAGDSYVSSTHLAGIICANGGITGVAPDANIIDLVVVNKSGIVTENVLVDALKWIVNYAKSGELLTCVLVPLRSSEYSEETHNLVDQLNSMGIIVVAPFAVSIGAYDTGSEVPIYAHNIGVELNMYAPGSKCLSCITSGMYSSMTGTGQAMAHVCGVICLLSQKVKAETNTGPTVEEFASKSGKKKTRITPRNPVEVIAIYDKIISLLIDDHVQVLGYGTARDAVLKYVVEKDVSLNDSPPTPVSVPVPVPSSTLTHVSSLQPTVTIPTIKQEPEVDSSEEELNDLIDAAVNGD